MTYPGGKNGAGVYQTIINRMPPHDVYIEPFLGSGAVLRSKRPARLNIGLDLDPQVIQQWQACTVRNDDTPGRIARYGDVTGDARFQFQQGDGLAFLRSYPFTWRELVYCDPPYLHATRRGTNIYRFEMDDAQHSALLDIITALPCMVMLSGYWSARL
jgi:DNA adenine methylase